MIRFSPGFTGPGMEFVGPTARFPGIWNSHSCRLNGNTLMCKRRLEQPHYLIHRNIFFHELKELYGLYELSKLVLGSSCPEKLLARLAFLVADTAELDLQVASW